MKTPLFCWLLAFGTCSLNFSCRAQNVEGSSSLAGYYLEANLRKTSYEVFYPGTPGVVGTSPWAVAIGKQLTPRWAVQLGYAFRHDGARDDPAYTGTTLSGQKIYGWRSFDTWTHSLPLTVRYAVIAQPRSRWQVDILAGTTWVSARGAAAGEEFIDGQSKGVVSNQVRTNHLYVTAGLGVRYAFGRRLEGVFDYGLVRNLKWAPDYIHLNTVGNKWGLTRSMSLGLRYRFNFNNKTD